MFQQKNRGAALWAKVVPYSQFQKSRLKENNEQPVKKIALFDEIFPASKSLPDVESGNISWYNENTFYKAIGPVLVAGQFFGVLPVSGLMGLDYTSLKFTWKSFRVFYSFVKMFFVMSMVIFCLGRIFDDGVDIYRTINLMFFTSALTSLILFLHMAAKWPNMCEAIAKEELNKNPMYYRLSSTKWNKRSLRVRFGICTFIVLFFALIEHVLSIISGVAVAYDCPKNNSAIHNYFVNAYPHVFYFTDYSIGKAMFLQPINFSATFNWNFTDLFIILMSITLTERFELLGDRLDLVKGKNLPDHFWRAARIEFANLVKLVRLVDENINKVVLLSFANNLYFICLQLFNSLKRLRVYSHLLYFVFSFGFLLGRSLYVSLRAAKINTAAQRPAVVLYSVPSESYCVEVRRFLEQVTSDTVGLTGYSFFYITRGLILTIAGTIVTYELVLVQFNTSPPPVTANLTISGIDNCKVI